MKYLIDKNCNVTMKGSRLTARADESIYADGKDTYSIATMKEIARANGFKISTSKKTAEVKVSFDEALSKLELAKVGTMKVSEEVKKIVQEGTDNDLSESQILVEIVNSGVDFGKAIKQFKEAKIELGLSISEEDRKKKAVVIMEDDGFEPKTYADVTKMAKTLAKDIPNTNESQALAQIRKFCKDNKLEIPKKEKGPSTPFGIVVMAWMFNNIDKTVDDLEEWLEEKEKGENVIKLWTAKFTQLQKEINTTAIRTDNDLIGESPASQKASPKKKVAPKK